MKMTFVYCQGQPLLNSTSINPFSGGGRLSPPISDMIILRSFKYVLEQLWNFLTFPDYQVLGMILISIFNPNPPSEGVLEKNLEDGFKLQNMNLGANEVRT